MAELDDEDVKNCINCNEKITDYHKIDVYPDTFSVYLCPECGQENDWWILYGFGKRTNRQSIIRALFLDSFLQRNEISYDQAIHQINEKYKDEAYSDSDINNDLNRLFKKVLENKGIKANRHPLDKLHDEKYYKIVIDHNNKFEDFFNGRIVRQWDLQYLSVDLKELKERIKKNEKIRFKNRWMAACDYFIDCAESENC